jgi:DNA mismatch endonuclease (patch repair protein)
MADIVSPEKRSQMMSGIRGKNTKPEIAIRKALHKLGFRYRIHVKNLPGKPDLVFPKYNAVLFIHGCFWHGHEDCPLFRWPSSRTEFWKTKITRNRELDKTAVYKLRLDGWRVGSIWECSMRGKSKRTEDYIYRRTTVWLLSNKPYFQLTNGKTKVPGNKT